MKVSSSKLNTIVLISIILLISLFRLILKINYDNKLTEVYNEFTPFLAEYLDSKYEERMIIEDEISFYEIYRFQAYPENNPEVSFTVELRSEAEPIFYDDYLETHARWEGASAVGAIVGRYVEHYSCNASLWNLTALREVAQIYYASNKRPLSWYDDGCYSEMGEWLIYLYACQNENLEVETLLPILAGIEQLGANFVTKEVKFFIYEHENSREPTIQYVYEFKDEKYYLTRTE
jgi:hypothetical protein